MSDLLLLYTKTVVDRPSIPKRTFTMRARFQGAPASASWTVTFTYLEQLGMHLARTTMDLASLHALTSNVQFRAQASTLSAKKNPTEFERQLQLYGYELDPTPKES